MPVVTQIHTNGLADNSVTDEKINNSDTFNFTGTSKFNAGDSTITNAVTSSTLFTLKHWLSSTPS